MTKGPHKIETEAPRPVQAVDNPILCSPYEEPDQHWVYKSGVPERVPGRRSAGYWFKEKRLTKKSDDMFEEAEREEQRDDLPLINRLREDVRRWREAEYRGASRVTRDLLKHWRKDVSRPLFYCQLEAVETQIYLQEMRIPERSARTGFKKFELGDAELKMLLDGENPNFEEYQKEDYFPRLIDPSEDYELALRRIGTKMATGSGKTIVMAMMIAWAFCNRGKNPASKEYPNGVLICAPNLTVRSRLQVLIPGSPGNYYDEFSLVPSRYRDFLQAGKILITNWHTFAARSENSEGGTTYRVVQKGEETPEAFARIRLGNDLCGRFPILVLNDEGHHCWRPPVKEEEEKTEDGKLSKDQKEDRQTARIWLDGLDRINNSGLLGPGVPCIHACIDLSATPFYLGGSGHPEGRPFPWLVSDFGLVDAIESGIVKIPRLPVMDDTGDTDEANRPDPKYFTLWEHIKDEIQPAEKIRKKPKPDAVLKYGEDALKTILGKWVERFDLEMAAGEGRVPPVIILVCDNTDIAEVFFQEISGQSEIETTDNKGKTVKEIVYGGNPSWPELANDENHRYTIKIDSKQLEKEVVEGKSGAEAAAELRKIIDTVGKKGQPGEHIRCVVSVSMLTEGWDTNTVTHILGIRAFGSQLLCEQVVGRGLRRMSYRAEKDENGRLMLPPEYVDIYGVPFSLIPFKGRTKESSTDDKPRQHIYAMEERSEFEVRFPNVEGYTYTLDSMRVKCDVAAMEELVLTRRDTPNETFMRMTTGYVDDTSLVADGNWELHDRSEFYERHHLQQIEFNIANLLMENLLRGQDVPKEKRGAFNLQARHTLFPQLLRIVQEYVQTKVDHSAVVDIREIALQRYTQLMVERLRDGVQAQDGTAEGRLIPIIDRFTPYGSTSTVDTSTLKPTGPTTKSHINLVEFDSGWEKEAAEILEALDIVKYYARNGSYLGFGIPYDYGEVTHKYEPDFIVILENDVRLILEIKGYTFNEQDRVEAKNAASKKWVTAVNNAKRYGTWAFAICYEPNSLLEGENLESRLRSILDSQDQAASVG